MDEAEPFTSSSEKMEFEPNTQTSTTVPQTQVSPPVKWRELPKDFGILTKFISPLILTLTAPEVAQQALNRGLTSLASDEITTLLASFGLAFYLVKLLIGPATETRHIGMVILSAKEDYKRLFILSTVLGVVFSLLLLVIGLSPFGVWLIRDVHGQPSGVTELTMQVLCWLAPIPLLEAMTRFHEGHLIQCKQTMYVGIAQMTDSSLQIIFTITLLFTPTKTDPILIPVFSLYAGYIGKTILTIGFWVAVSQKSLQQINSEKGPVSILRVLLFWAPLALVRSVQVVTRPIINLMVAMQLSAVNVESSTAAIAVLSACFPMANIFYAWLNDLRTLLPTFSKGTPTHKKYSVKILAGFTLHCTLISVLVAILVLYMPNSAYTVMHVIIGLPEELAHMSVVPLRIMSAITCCLGLRAFITGYLMVKKKTVFLIPSAIIRITVVILTLYGAPKISQLSGAKLGATTLLVGFSFETLLVIGSGLIVSRMKIPEASKESTEVLDLKQQSVEETNKLPVLNGAADALAASITSLSVYT